MKEQNTSLWQRLKRWHFVFSQDRSGSSPESWVQVTSISPSQGDQRVRQCFQARVQSLSPGGMSLIVQEPIEPGTLLKIETLEKDEAPFLWTRVIHAVPGENGELILGCIFPRELDDEELEFFGGHRLRPGFEDYRAWVRFPCDSQATYTPSSSSEIGEWQAQVTNVSPSGIGLVVSKEF